VRLWYNKFPRSQNEGGVMWSRIYWLIISVVNCFSLVRTLRWLIASVLKYATRTNLTCPLPFTLRMSLYCHRQDSFSFSRLVNNCSVRSKLKQFIIEWSVLKQTGACWGIATRTNLL